MSEQGGQTQQALPTYPILESDTRAVCTRKLVSGRTARIRGGTRVRVRGATARTACELCCDCPDSSFSSSSGEVNMWATERAADQLV